MEKRVKNLSPEMKKNFLEHGDFLKNKLFSANDKISAWFKEQWSNTPAPFYGSMDLRNSGFKLAPVDMNLFPAGFNNLKKQPAFIKLSIDAVQKKIQKLSLSAKKVLIFPEEHTRNMFYWENISTLSYILKQAGCEVKVGAVKKENIDSQNITLSDGSVISIEEIKKRGTTIELENFVPELILLNNDLSESVPSILENVNQMILPPTKFGWNERLKTHYFKFYSEVAEEFSALAQIDPWLITPLFKQCNNVNFMLREGENELAQIVEELLNQIKVKYASYQIPLEPFVVIKADSGTYGMGVMMVKDPSEIKNLNRKQRTNMAKTKGGKHIQQVIIQEGVHTLETINHSPAEPVMYMIDEALVGGFYRVHQDKQIDENLNSPGMHFEPMAIDTEGYSFQYELSSHPFYVYGIITKLSMLAAAREIYHLS